MNSTQLHDAVTHSAQPTSHSPTALIDDIQTSLRSLQSDGTGSCAKSSGDALGEFRVVLVVLAVLGVTELAFLTGKQRLSKDVEHLQSVPALAERFATTAGSGPKMLFLGNSLTRYGIDEQVFAESFSQATGVSPRTLKIVPDNTAVADWFYVYRNQFAQPDRAPDVLVIGFEGGHLRDAPSRHTDRLAQFYCGWCNWPDLCRFDLPDFESQASFALAKCSALYGNRDRVTRRALDVLIPGYRAGMDRINASLQSHAVPSTSAAPRYERLRELILDAQRQHVRVVLAAMPVPEHYEFDAELLAVVQQTGVELLDLRRVNGIEPAMFFDGLHMDADAARLYSRALAVKLAEAKSGSFALQPAGGL